MLYNHDRAKGYTVQANSKIMYMWPHASDATLEHIICTPHGLIWIIKLLSVNAVRLAARIKKQWN